MADDNPVSSSLARVILSSRGNKSNFDIETGFFEGTVKEQPPRAKPSLSTQEPNLPTAEVKELVREIHVPVYYQRKCRISLAQDGLKTSASNARVVPHRHSTFFGDSESPGHSGTLLVQSDMPSGASSVLTQSKSLEKRIHRARGIYHGPLFDCTISVMSLESEKTVSAVTAASAFKIAANALAHPKVPVFKVDTEPVSDASDRSSVTAESYDDLCTPPSTPARRALVVQSDFYGGSINYSLRLSRNTEKFEVIMNQLYGDTASLVDTRTLEESFLGF